MSLRQRLLAMLDSAVDQCVESWRVLAVLMPAGTFVFFTLVLFFGSTVTGALAFTKVLAAIEIVLAVGILVLNLKYRRRVNAGLEAADAIEAKISDDDVFSDWDEFIADPAGDPEVERIRLHCLGMAEEFPPVAPDEYCNHTGIEVLEGYVRQLRAGVATRAVQECSERWQAWRAARNSADESVQGVSDPEKSGTSRKAA